MLVASLAQLIQVQLVETVSEQLPLLPRNNDTAIHVSFHLFLRYVDTMRLDWQSSHRHNTERKHTALYETTEAVRLARYSGLNARLIHTIASPTFEAGGVAYLERVIRHASAVLRLRRIFLVVPPWLIPHHSFELIDSQLVLLRSESTNRPRVDAFSKN